LEAIKVRFTLDASRTFMSPNFSTLFPTERISFYSKLSKEDLIQRLDSETETSILKNTLPLFPKSYKVFRGKLNGDEFTVMSSPVTIFSYLTCYHGTFKSANHGTEIELELKLHNVIKFALLVWLFVILGCCLVTTALILQALFNQAGSTSYHPVVLFPILLIAANLIIGLLPIKLHEDDGLLDLQSLFRVGC
jgi:uncharacterized protein with PQ loop repeat